MSRQYIKQGRIAIFREHHDENSKRPIMKGKVEFEDERQDLLISLWVKIDKSGKKYMAGDVQVVIEEEEVAPEEPVDSIDSEDDLPF